MADLIDKVQLGLIRFYPCLRGQNVLLWIWTYDIVVTMRKYIDWILAPVRLSYHIILFIHQ
jgi:hypothetical protein